MNTIKNKKDYESALKQIEKLWGAKINSKDSDELDILATLVEKYENEHYAVDFPDPNRSIKFKIEVIDFNKRRR